ncbi:FAD-dependent oxidoreductase [Agrobacterium sp. NPDC090283]|uniref:FAD-dependent oxidoreductase n=1 Tax=Agrobacterium sp. NPDC090283 TaxID=3363920 RepID=UPI00383B91D2
MERDFDVVVIGGGGAGLSAALAAAENSARTLLVDAAGKLGGSTALSGGVFYAAGTAIQQANGVSDTAEAMYHHYMTLNRHAVSPPLVKKLCNEANSTLEWLISLGVRYTDDGLYFSGCDEVPRGHRPIGAGAEIIERLEGALSQHGVDIALATRITGLVVNEDGMIGGVQIGDDTVTASAVVLATGGFGANPQMLSFYFPDHRMGGDYLWYVGADTSQGDGIKMGVSAGARVVGFNRGQLTVTHGFARDNEVEQPGWLVHINREGQRFVNETLSYAVLADRVKQQTQHECFSIFDEAARLSLERANPRQPCWQKDLLLQYLQEGYLVRAGSLAELAERMEIPVTAFEATFAQYNAECAAGEDRQFFKGAEHLRAMISPPFYAARMKPGILGLTLTGLQIDDQARVLDVQGCVIPGLFAAGETTGGVIGEIYTASGNSIANAIIFGRTAGRSAAALSHRP